MNEAQRLNADAHAAGISGAALQQALQAQGDAWYESVKGRCLFAAVPVFISSAQLRQMMDVIEAVERVVNNEKWMIENEKLETEHRRPETGSCKQGTENGKLKTGLSGVFYGYDFHLNSDGAHLIEINTNAGGAFLNAVLLDSQREVVLPGCAVSEADLDAVFIDMFRSEWRLARGDAQLKTIAILDEQPEQQYLYPEFLLAKRLFERAGIAAYIADPAALEVRDDGLYVGKQKIDLVYNRLTDFTLQQHLALLHLWLKGGVALTPNPAHYACYADKRNLARLTDVNELHNLGINEADIATLQAGIPHTFVVQPGLEASLWAERKQLFFKPYSGYGSRGAYRGEKLTKRVYGEILQSGYVAQKLAAPGERSVNDTVSLKYDVRAYVYAGKIQLVAARLYQGQTTNFRTQGGGFAIVRVVG